MGKRVEKNKPVAKNKPVEKNKLLEKNKLAEKGKPVEKYMPAWKPAAAAFVLNGMAAFLALIYFLVKNHGLMSLSNDFDAQALTFQIFANRSIKEGQVFFNWAIDLGSDFVSSFSFYNLGSPFFWITLLFPPAAFPYLVAWIYMLKYAVAGLTSYLYFRKYVKDPWYAVVGSVLYAFSGYQAANLVFYHFHDVTAFFPLLLLGLEDAVETKKYGRMALAVFINALVNWNFFVGEVIFLVVYDLVRYAYFQKLKEHRWKEVAGEVLHCALEGILGMGMAGVLLVPSVNAILSNTRISNHILGEQALAFSTQDYLQFFKALLLPNETLCNQSVLDTGNWYSIAAYLPMAGVVYVAVYLWRFKNDWICRLLKISLLTACIPVLNNCFTLFNTEPYRRWYYMPILIMALATVKILEQAVWDLDIRRLIRKSGIFTLGAIVILVAYFTQYRWSESRETCINSPRAFFLYLLLGIFGVVVAVCLTVYGYKSRFFVPLFLLAVMGAGCANTVFNIVRYHQNSDFASTENAYHEIVTSMEAIRADVLPYRYAFSESDAYYNRSFANSLTSVDSFISTVDNGIFEFYDAVGAHRHTITRDGPDGTDALLSAKYRVSFEPLDTADACTIYENDSRSVYVYEDAQALPIGFTYDSYMTRGEYDCLEPDKKAYAMLHTLIVADEDEAEAAKVLWHEQAADSGFFTAGQKEADIRKHLGECSSGFEHSARSFSSTIFAGAQKYAFYSVPYSSKWSATVNGEDVKILKVNGLMAVPVEEGENAVLFTYDTSVNQCGLLVSIFSAAAVVGIFLTGFFKGKIRRK